MELVKICLAALAGTYVMTVFSRYVSNRFQHIFKEPVVLSLVLSKLAHNKSLNHISTWEQGVRYLAGLFVVLCYHYIWTHTDIDPTWFCGLIFGIITGLGAIFYWFFLFRVSSVSKARFQDYYLPLVAAYILFAMTVIVVYRLFALFE